MGHHFGVHRASFHVVILREENQAKPAPDYRHQTGPNWFSLDNRGCQIPRSTHGSSQSTLISMKESNAWALGGTADIQWFPRRFQLPRQVHPVTQN